MMGKDRVRKYVEDHMARYDSFSEDKRKELAGWYSDIGDLHRKQSRVQRHYAFENEALAMALRGEDWEKRVLGEMDKAAK